MMMVDHGQIDLEQLLHSLLCGTLGNEERTAILSRIAHDQNASETLDEMIRVQRAARAAYGCWDAGEAINAGLTKLGPFLAARASSQPAARHRSIRQASLFRILSARWLTRIAAVAVIAASVHIAWDLHASNVRLRERLASQNTLQTEIPSLSPAELASYGRIWDQVADQGGKSIPWVLLSNGGGQFGYVTDDGQSKRGQLVVLRMMMVSPDGKVLKQDSILLPDQAVARLMLPEAGRLWGLPMGFEVSSIGQWAGVGLTIGETPSGIHSISGRVRIGDRPVEIGQLKVDDKDIRVIVQAVGVKTTG